MALEGSKPHIKEDTVHSGTGRISRIRLRPMSLFETGCHGAQTEFMELAET